MSDNKVGTNNTGIRVQIDQSRTRQTPVNASFGDVMSRSADAVLQAGQLAAPFIPGGAVLSAAITGVGSLKSSVGASTTSGGNGTALVAGSTGGTALSSQTAGYGAAGTAGTTGNSTGLDTISRMERMQETNQSFNMIYLEMQQKMQDESRRFTLLSNIMKTKHDTAKNSISNVR